LSVEELPAAQSCTADEFLDLSGNTGGSPTPVTVSDQGTDYSVASSTGAGAGNRYEEWVWAIPGSSPCTAVRYYIHYGVLENYPAGAVQQFDETALHNEFDAIRRSLVLGR
jgi:hypothetical protein